MSNNSLKNLKISKRTNYEVINYSLQDSDLKFIDERTVNRDRAINLAGGARSSQKISFRIQNGNFCLNPRNTFIQFDLKINGVAAGVARSYAKLDSLGIAACVRDFRVSLGGQTLETVTDFASNYKIMTTRLPEEYRQKFMQTAGLYGRDRTLTALNRDYELVQINKGAVALTNGDQTITFDGNQGFDCRQFFSPNDVIRIVQVAAGPPVGPGVVRESIVDTITNANEIEVKANYAGPDEAARNLTLNPFWIERKITSNDYKLNHGNNIIEDRGNKYIFEPGTVSGFFSQGRYFPMFVHSQDLQIDIVLNTDEIVLGGTKHAAVTYEITDAFIYYETLRPDESVIRMIQDKYMKEGLKIPMRVYTSIERQLSAASTEIQETYTESFTQLNKIYVFARDINYTQGITPPFELENLNPTEFYIEISNVRYPTNQYDLLHPAVMYAYNHQAHSIFGSYLFTNQSLKEYQFDNSQVISVDFQRYQEGNLTGINTTNKSIRVYMRGIGQTQNPAVAPVPKARSCYVLFEGTGILSMKNGQPISVFT